MITFTETDTSTGTVEVCTGAYTFHDRRALVNFVWDIIKDFTFIENVHYKNQPPGAMLVRVNVRGMEGECQVQHTFSHILRLTNDRVLYDNIESFRERCMRSNALTPAENETLIRLRDNLRLYV